MNTCKDTEPILRWNCPACDRPMEVHVRGLDVEHEHDEDGDCVPAVVQGYNALVLHLRHGCDRA